MKKSMVFAFSVLLFATAQAKAHHSHAHNESSHHAHHHMDGNGKDHDMHHMDHDMSAHKDKKVSMPSSDNLDISDCWVRLLPADKWSALFFTVTNKDEKQDAHLVSVSSEKFAQVFLHETYMKDGMASMRGVDEITVKAASQVQLAPGGYHAMLSKYTDVKVGDKVKFDLALSDDKKLPFECLVKDAKAMKFTD